MNENSRSLDWVRVAAIGELPEGRVKSVTARNVTLCLVHFDGQWTAMENRCPHQGGPLGEGSMLDTLSLACLGFRPADRQAAGWARRHWATDVRGRSAGLGRVCRPGG